MPKSRKQSNVLDYQAIANMLNGAVSQFNFLNHAKTKELLKKGAKIDSFHGDLSKIKFGNETAYELSYKKQEDKIVIRNVEDNSGLKTNFESASNFDQSNRQNLIEFCLEQRALNEKLTSATLAKQIFEAAIGGKLVLPQVSGYMLNIQIEQLDSKRFKRAMELADNTLREQQQNEKVNELTRELESIIKNLYVKCAPKPNESESKEDHIQFDKKDPNTFQYPVSIKANMCSKQSQNLNQYIEQYNAAVVLWQVLNPAEEKEHSAQEKLQEFTNKWQSKLGNNSKTIQQLLGTKPQGGKTKLGLLVTAAIFTFGLASIGWAIYCKRNNRGSYDPRVDGQMKEVAKSTDQISTIVAAMA